MHKRLRAKAKCMEAQTGDFTLCIYEIWIVLAALWLPPSKDLHPVFSFRIFFVFASPLAHKKNQKNNLPFKNFFHLFPPLWGPRVYDNPSPLCWFSGSSYRWLPAFFLFFCLVRLWVAGPRWHHLSRCLIVIRHTQSSWQELGGERAVWFGGGLWPLGNSRMALAKVAPAIKRRVCEEKWERGRKEDKTWPHHLMHL